MQRSTPGRLVLSLLVIACVGCLAATAPVAAVAAVTAKHPSAPTPGPSGLKCYAPAELPAGPHGTLIRERSLHSPAAFKHATAFVRQHLGKG